MTSVASDDASPGRFPDFLILGAPKCGTTTLYEVLNGHPSLHFPRKEPGFLSQDVENTERYREHVPDLAAYRQLFTATPAGALAGEATPRTLYSAEAISILAAHRPDAKLIAVLRDPVDLVFSYHAQKLREGQETEADFERAWRRCVDGETGRALSDAPWWKGRINYPYWGRFGAPLTRWRAAAGGRLLLMHLDELNSSLVAAYRRILDHLGVADDGREVFAMANERVDIRHPTLNRLAVTLQNQLHPVLAPIRQARGGQSLGLLRRFQRLNTKPLSSRPAVSRDFRQFMMQAFEDDLLLAEEIYGHPVRRLGAEGDALEP
ncbi:putative deacetylase sulfotransferase [Parvularcula bermudensis HTCC2503]|uniref:Putative deacetylase sulfotransferase n=1 Tax=Parvularcula bermudensis (strain ATCC BAA-594 / HTCC2503 / KCTC 12087) TaxID=314260 RepID=E0TC49_PARBH|nr:putative deacetylase sulfotransferase [Parvularcula bermudensis HTCC2503]